MRGIFGGGGWRLGRGDPEVPAPPPSVLIPNVDAKKKVDSNMGEDVWALTVKTYLRTFCRRLKICSQRE